MNQQHAPLSEEANSPVEIVVTVPKPYAAALAVKARARMTLGALVQLIAGAERYVILSAPYIQEYESASELLYQALRGALRRGVDVDIVSTQAGLAAVARRDLGRRAKGRLRYYRPRANVLDETRLGSHAKLCVCDGAHAYIGSANLTAPGLSEHLEIGVLVHGQAAQQVESFWRLVFEEGLLVASEQA